MPYSAPNIRFCTSRDGTQIAFEICGSGPPLVWVQHWAHHLELDWASPIWRPWLSFLTQRYTLIRFDWRGCGLSDRDHIQFSTDAYVDDLEAVVDAAAVERFSMFGMAGAMCGAAMTYAVRHPARVRNLILYASYTHGRLGAGLAPELVEETEARIKVTALGWQNDIPAYSQFFTALHIPDASDEQSHAYGEMLRRTTSPRNVVAMLRNFHRIDLRDIVPKVCCPTLVSHVRQDAVIPFDEGRAVAALIPGARFVPLESRNHVILATEPAWQQFITAFEGFLPASPAASAESSLDTLTARERDILEAVAQGLDNSSIAARLKISEKTVRNHVSIIFSKLGVNSRAQVIILARNAGFGHRLREAAHESPPLR